MASKKQAATDHLSWVIRLWKWLGVAVLIGILFLVSIKVGIWGALPDTTELENPKIKLASEIYSSDNTVLGKMFYQEDRTNCDFSDIPPHLKDALIATEDARLYEHSGIDAKALIRAIVRLGRDGGGSTITQQLALNLFQERVDNFAFRIIQKIKEWFLAIEIEKRYTKDEIILMYFNTVPYGNSYGIKSASKRYFNKKTKDLTIEEAAVLVGMLKANTYYNPVRNPENATRRRNVVLNQMEKYNFLDERECDSLKELPLVVNHNFVDHNNGLATYFRSYLDQWMKDWTR